VVGLVGGSKIWTRGRLSRSKTSKPGKSTKNLGKRGLTSKGTNLEGIGFIEETKKRKDRFTKIFW